MLHRTSRQRRAGGHSAPAADPAAPAPPLTLVMAATAAGVFVGALLAPTAPPASGLAAPGAGPAASIAEAVAGTPVRD